MSSNDVGMEVEQTLRFLANMPGVGRTTMTKKPLRALLLRTDGVLLAQGYAWDILTHHIGAGVYRVTTRRAA